MTDLATVLFEKIIKIENKDIFFDVKQNKNGIYFKISERSKGNKNTVAILIFNF